jgi:cytoskeleton-associated protein 5
MLEKCKERKQQFQQALRDALDAVVKHACPGGIGDITENFVEFSKSKNPQVRQETVTWMTRSMTATKKAPNKSDAKAISESLCRVYFD